MEHMQTQIMAWLPWVWDIYKKQRKLPKKERAKVGISQVISTLSIGKNFRKSPPNILLVIPLFHNTSDGEK